MAVRVESTRRRGVRGAMLALGVAATLVGCKDAEVTRIPTPIQVDLTSCLGDATGALPGGDQTTCRATLGAAVESRLAITQRRIQLTLTSSAG